MILIEQDQIVKRLGNLTTSRSVYVEMGEPILYDVGDVWFFDIRCRQVIGFCAINIKSKKLKYLYTVNESRGEGIGSKLLNDAIIFCKTNNILELSAVCPTAYLQFYQNRGFDLIKSFKNYHKIKTTISNGKSIIQNYRTGEL